MRDLFTIEQLIAHPDLKMKKYKQSIYYGIILNGKRHGFGKQTALFFFRSSNYNDINEC